MLFLIDFNEKPRYEYFQQSNDLILSKLVVYPYTRSLTYASSSFYSSLYFIVSQY